MTPLLQWLSTLEHERINVIVSAQPLYVVAECHVHLFSMRTQLTLHCLFPGGLSQMILCS